MSDLPTGTVTFLFTDIEGSTKRWEHHPQQMQIALARHNAILRQAIEANGGYIFKTVGDAFCAAFSSPADALLAGLAAQQALHNERWSEQVGALPVRMALHTGVVEQQGGDYFGQPVNRVARLLSAAHGGQTILSDPTYDLVRDNLPAGVALTDMGEHRLKDLQRPEHIFQLTAPGLPSQFPPLKTLENRPNNLPVQPTPFIGREKDVAAICALLGRPDVRLVTITGPGGAGKTRLALQSAADMLDDFRDGVFSVELAALTDPALVPSTIAQALGVTESAGKPIVDTLKSYLADKQMLLVLDNFEQVAGAAPVVDALMRGVRLEHLKMLVTSRVGLNLYGEHEHAVPPLALPDPKHLPTLERLTQYEAVRLFIERAQAAKSGFQVTNDNAPAVAEICVRLDGLPLAIELAAARIKLFPPQALLSRLSNRLKLLTGGASNLPGRQQTLRGAIAWSYELLGEGEKQLFGRMAVFQGGRTLEALEAVCNYDGELQLDVLDGVQLLMDQSLLQQREGSDGEPRFWMLETIHEYASEKLEESGETEELEREHALYFMALAEEAEPHTRTGAKQIEWLARLDEEHDNLRAALQWARAVGAGENTDNGDAEAVEVGLRIAGALRTFWAVRGYYSEGREHLAAMLALSDASTTSTAQALPSQSQSHALVSFRAKALYGAGNLALNQGDYTGVPSLYEESLAIRRELGDKWGIASSLMGLAGVAYNQENYAGARSLFEESLAIFRELGDKWGIAWLLRAVARVAHVQGDYASARSLNDEGLVILREVGDRKGIAISLNNLGIVACMQGDYTSARSLYEESLAILQELGDKVSIPVGLAGLGAVAAGMGQAERGARLLGTAEALLEAVNFVLEADDRMVYEQGVASARAQLSEEAFQKAWAEGRAMSMEQAIEYALHELGH